MELITNVDLCGNVFWRLLALVGLLALLYWSVKWSFRLFLRIRFLKRCYWPSKRFEERAMLCSARLTQARDHWSRTTPSFQQRIIDLLGDEIDNLIDQAKKLDSVVLVTLPVFRPITATSDSSEKIRKLRYDYMDLRMRLTNSRRLKVV